MQIWTLLFISIFNKNILSHYPTLPLRSHSITSSHFAFIQYQHQHQHHHHNVFYLQRNELYLMIELKSEILMLWGSRCSSIPYPSRVPATALRCSVLIKARTDKIKIVFLIHFKQQLWISTSFAIFILFFCLGWVSREIQWNIWAVGRSGEYLKIMKSYFSLEGNCVAATGRVEVMTVLLLMGLLCAMALLLLFVCFSGWNPKG